MREILCIKDFKSGDIILFEKNKNYKISYEDEYQCVVEYPPTEYQRLEILLFDKKEDDYDRHVSFYKTKNGKFFSPHNLNEYFSDRINKLSKLSAISLD